VPAVVEPVGAGLLVQTGAFASVVTIDEILNMRSALVGTTSVHDPPHPPRCIMTT